MWVEAVPPCPKRRHDEAADDSIVMQERIKRLRITPGSAPASPTGLVPGAAAAAHAGPHPGLARAWAMAEAAAYPDASHAAAWSSAPPTQPQPHFAPQAFPAHGGGYGANGMAVFPGHMHTHAPPYCIPQAAATTHVVPAPAPPPPPPPSLPCAPANTTYQHINSLLGELHSERVFAGARRSWVEDGLDEDDDEDL